MQTVNIQLNENVIKKMREIDIYPDICGTVIFVLFALAENKIELLNEIDDKSTSKRMILLYRLLERRSLLKETEKEDASLYKLSKQGIELVNWLKNEFDDEISAEDFLEPQIEEKSDFMEELANKYVALFPKSHRSHPKVIAIRFEKFFKMFPEFKKIELILCATELYIKEYKKKSEDLQFMRNAQYLIWKADGKETLFDLATWCERCNSQEQNTEIDMNFLNTV